MMKDTIPQDIYETLYAYEEDGRFGYDLQGVMLSDDIFNEQRVERLIALLSHDDKYIVYQASLILMAWCRPEGFAQFEQFYLQRWDQKQVFDCVDDIERVYEQFAYAFKMSLLNGNTETDLLPYIKKLLILFPTVYLAQNLKDLLLFLNNNQVYSNFVEQAFTQALATHGIRQASFLFPVLVKCDASFYSRYLAQLSGASHDSMVQANIEDAQAYS